MKKIIINGISYFLTNDNEVAVMKQIDNTHSVVAIVQRSESRIILSANEDEETGFYTEVLTVSKQIFSGEIDMETI